MIERVKMQSKKTIGISIDRDLLTDIDGLRGLVPRSAYIADLLYKAIRAPT
jgi:metal-responsive CopG/Arc/MetJ family transcriptional regulator